MHAYPQIPARKRDGWQERETTLEDARVDLTSKTLFVPYGPSESELAVRNHERAHIRWTPANGNKDVAEIVSEYGFPDGNFLAQHIENLRVDTLSAMRGVPIPNMPETIKRQKLDLELTEERKQSLCKIGYALSNAGRGSKNPFKLSEVERNIVRKVQLMLRNSALEWEGTLRALRYLGEIFGGENLKRFTQDKDGKFAPLRIPCGEWGKMEVQRIPLTVRVKSSVPAPSPSANGIKVGNLSRLYADGRILLRKAIPKVSASVLVDCSGSMSWSEEDLQAVLEQSPCATIAAYGGRESDGTLVVLADKGKRAKIMPKLPKGNVVDGPALRWIAKHGPAPRYWLSDGQATGIGEVMMVESAEAIRASLGVIRVPNLEELLARLP